MAEEELTNERLHPTQSKSLSLTAGDFARCTTVASRAEPTRSPLHPHLFPRISSIEHCL